MFLSYLEPYSVRNKKAPYLWVFYKQLMHFNTDEISFVLSKDYLEVSEDREEFKDYSKLKNWYKIPEEKKLNNYNYFFINEEVYKDLENRFQSKTKIFEFLISQKYEPLINEFEKIIREVKDVEAIFLWINNPSVEYVAKKYNIPIVYNELGPLRFPHYLNTAYFCFEGLHFDKEAKKRFENFKREIKEKELFEIEELRNLFFVGEYQENIQYKIGVPLQVEDDSNLLVYNNGYDNLKLLDEINFSNKKTDILIRNHPLSSFKISNNKYGGIDNSKNSIEFLSKCEKIVTINSSVGFETVFFGKSVEIKGESSFKFLTQIKNEEMKYALNFYLINYLILYDLLYDIEYLKFRLNNPTEKEIFFKNKNLILNYLNNFFKEHHRNFYIRRIEKYEKELLSQKEKYENQLKSQKEKYENQLKSQKEKYDKELLSQKEKYENQLKSQKEKYETLMNKYKQIEYELVLTKLSKSWKYTRFIRKLKKGKK